MAYSGVYVKPNPDPSIPFPFLDFATQSKPRVLVFGSRDWPHIGVIRRDMVALSKSIGAYTLVHGAARGADSYADKIAESIDFERDPFPAYWSEDGRAAGVIRNQKMLDSGIDYAMGYILNESRGSEDMLRRLRDQETPRLVTRLETMLYHGFPDVG